MVMFSRTLFCYKNDKNVQTCFSVQTFLFQLSNHDLGRVSSRKGTEYLDGMNMLLMMLPGSAILYYGDEIGMQHITVKDQQTEVAILDFLYICIIS